MSVPLAAVGASLDLFQVIVLALLQGIAELFPISSLGHTVILPTLLHWHINQQAPAYLAFVVLLHFGTAGALLLFYWRDWLRLLRALCASLARGTLSDDPDERFIWLIIVGTVPTVVLALLFEHPLRENFGQPRTAALLLAANGLLMLAGEVLRRRQSATAHARLVGAGRAGVSQEDADGALTSASRKYKEVDKLGWRGALIVGLFQALALFPGISRY